MALKRECLRGAVDNKGDLTRTILALKLQRRKAFGKSTEQLNSHHFGIETISMRKKQKKCLPYLTRTILALKQTKKEIATVH